MSLPRRSTLKTYSHLSGARRMPTDYELLTSKLLYYPALGGFEVQTPIAAWYRTYQQDSAFAAEDFASFQDPRQTTYGGYTSLQAQQEAGVEALFRSMEAADYQEALGAEAIALFQDAWAPLRFLLHGLQMAAAYVGQMAPEGRLTVCAAFQTADELRRIQRVAYRLALLRTHVPDVAVRAREYWERADALQPLRELIEKLLSTYDFSEALVALGLGVKPVLDGWVFGELAAASRSAGDYLWTEVSSSLKQDGLWHAAWAHEAVKVALLRRPELDPQVAEWTRRWRALATAAVQALAAETLTRGARS